MRLKLKELHIIDEGFKITASNKHLFIPIKEGANASSFELEACDVESVSRQRLSTIGLNYEVIGDIAILDGPPYDDALARQLIQMRKDVNVVLAAVGGIHGQFRLKDFIYVAGEQRTTTVYKEYGCSFLLDLAKVYFNPRLATERHRIAGLVKPSEVLVDMFAGVGPFTVVLAKKVSAVFAFELNPIAVEYLRKNVERNHVKNVVIREGDAKSLALQSRGLADRVIMNLPHAASDFLSEALIVLSENGGTIHYYDIAPEDEVAQAGESARKAIEQQGRSIEHLYVKKVRSYSPHRYIVVVDIHVAASSQ